MTGRTAVATVGFTSSTQVAAHVFAANGTSRNQAFDLIVACSRPTTTTPTRRSQS